MTLKGHKGRARGRKPSGTVTGPKVVEVKPFDRLEGLSSAVWGTGLDWERARTVGKRFHEGTEPVYVMAADGETVVRVEPGREVRVPMFELRGPLGDAGRESIHEKVREGMRALLRAVHEGGPRVEVARAGLLEHFREVYRSALEGKNASVLVYEQDGVAYGSWYPPLTRVRWEHCYEDEPDEVDGELVLRVGLVVHAQEVRTAAILEA